MSKKLTINVDVDGVVYAFNEAMQALAEVYLEQKLPKWDTWTPSDMWPVTKAEWWRMFDRAIVEDEVFAIGRPIEGAVEGVTELIRQGHRVRYVTSKSLSGRRATLQARLQCTRWLDKQGILHGTELCFVDGDKSGYQADLVIDDKPTLDWVQSGAVNLLFDQAWNRGIGERSDPKLVRVGNWAAVLKIVEVS